MSQPTRQDDAANANGNSKPIHTRPSLVWTGRFVGGVFGTIIAPLIVAVILKMLDSPPAPKNDDAQAPKIDRMATAAVENNTPAIAASASSDRKVEKTDKVKTEPKPALPQTALSPEAPAKPIVNVVPVNADTVAVAPRVEPAAKPNPTAVEEKPNQTTAEEKNSPSPSAEWMSLFNGNNFTGWIVPKTKHWSIDPKSRSIVADAAQDPDKPMSFLITTEEFSDFRLRLEFRMSQNADSGIALRTLEREKPTERLQIQLFGGESKTQKIPMGAIIGLPTSETDENTRPKTPVMARAPQSWNVAEIEFRGPRLKVTINGNLLHDVRITEKAQLPNARPDLLRTSGHIGLQSQTGRIEFRRIEVNRLEGGRSPRQKEKTGL